MSCFIAIEAAISRLKSLGKNSLLTINTITIKYVGELEKETEKISIAWYVYDAKTPQNGGRFLPLSRGFKAWEHLRDFFPIKLHKDSELDPNNNYILGYHPHGITVYGAFTNFGVCATGWDELFPGVQSRLLTIETYYKFPFFRDYILFSGLQSRICYEIRFKKLKNNRLVDI